MMMLKEFTAILVGLSLFSTVLGMFDLNWFDLLNEHGDLYFLLQISDHYVIKKKTGKDLEKNHVNFYFLGITLSS